MSQLIRLALHGLGKVGELVTKVAELDHQIQLAATIDPQDTRATYTDLSQVDLQSIDGIIDFSHASALEPMIAEVARQNPRVKIVVGTSGWNDRQETIRKLIGEQGLFVLYGANFSLATAIYMQVVDFAAGLLAQAEGFDPAVMEIHHRLKADMPSGTAKAIAGRILRHFPGKKRILYGMTDRAIREDELHVASLRQGENKGYHQVTFDSASDTLLISEQTHDRTSYALGALKALKWLHAQTAPGYYTFDDVLRDLFVSTSDTGATR